MTPQPAPPAASPPLTYFPAYLGLFAALVLAATCNAFLDIQYGTFGFEVLIWSLLFGFTLRLGWRQRGQVSATGKQGQKMMLILGILLSLVIFIPMWGFPRAGLAMLAMLQAAQNCVTVSRRQLHLGLLVSAVMVMFAASHYRADWTMLFYLLPYLTAVVFTLVAEQINRRSHDLQRHSLAQAMAGGQGAAIAAATAAILLLGALLYALTPQWTWPYLQWRYGQLTQLGEPGQGEEIEVGSQPGSQGLGQGGSGGGSAGQGSGQAGQGPGQEWQPGQGWPSLADMRQAAKRQGMPAWQRDAINSMADAGEQFGRVLQPIKQQWDALWKSFQDWLEQNRRNLLLAIALLALLALFYALWRLMREAKTGTWLLTRLDYLRYIVLGPAPGAQGARQLYAAMERLFALQDARRAQQANTREYLARIYDAQGHLYREAAELTRLFEDARYGAGPADDFDNRRMRALYRQIFDRV